MKTPTKEQIDELYELCAYTISKKELKCIIIWWEKIRNSPK